MKWPLTLVLAVAGALWPAAALAHEAPPGQNNLIEEAIHRVFEVVPEWLFALAVAGALLLPLGFYLVLRRWRFIVFVDRSE